MGIVERLESVLIIATLLFMLIKILMCPYRFDREINWGSNMKNIHVYVGIAKWNEVSEKFEMKME